MAKKNASQTQASLGLTGLTGNAMALIAPGAFLWLTFYIQASSGLAASSMWCGVLVALLLSLATAVAYAEISKLYPGEGSSYYYAEQAMLSTESAFKYARIAKFVVGWGSHLYYWVYPGVMVGLAGLFVGYVVGFLFPEFLSGSYPGPVFMGAVAALFAFFVAWIAAKGAGASTSVNLAINVVQISALALFGLLALGYRAEHPSGARALQYDLQTHATYAYQFAVDNEGVTLRDTDGSPLPLLDRSGQPVPFLIAYPTQDKHGAFLTHASAASVVGAHKVSWVFLQTTIAILILVGFESVTALSGEAKNPRRHIPIAVIASLLIQGALCYLFVYFAANYFLNSGYTMADAAASAAPIGDMMILIGDALLGQGRGKYFMLFEALTVFLALVGATLSCMNTGARVTYAMSKDEEAPAFFGVLQGKASSPRRALWALAALSAMIGAAAVSTAFGGASAPCDAAISLLPQGLFSSFGYTTHEAMAALPNSLLTITLLSNFGAFLLYSLSCLLAIVAYAHRPERSLLRHVFIPALGLATNLVCMAYYVLAPFLEGGSSREPFLALVLAIAWGFYGAIYFIRNSLDKGRTMLLAISVKSGE